MDLGFILEGLGEGFREHLAIQNASLKSTIDFFNKIAIFKGFGEDLGRVLAGVWEVFGTFWKDFERSGGTLGVLRAFC